MHSSTADTKISVVVHRFTYKFTTFISIQHWIVQPTRCTSCAYVCTYLWRRWYTPLSTITMHPSRFVVWTGQSAWWARTPFHCQLIGYNPLIMLPGGKEWPNKITVCKLLGSVRVLVAEPVFAFWTDKTLRDICAQRMQGKVRSMYVCMYVCTHYYNRHTCRNIYQGWECTWTNNSSCTGYKATVNWIVDWAALHKGPRHPICQHKIPL